MQRSFSGFGAELNGQLQHSRALALGMKRPSRHGTQPWSEMKFPGGQYDADEPRASGSSANTASSDVEAYMAIVRRERTMAFARSSVGSVQTGG
ncbi:hypothetical protein FGB62_159g15 [Gracilaria domingensis]|nr:hypothetical protein FGB62_159g15 [Gracilaria domingensis]